MPVTEVKGCLIGRVRKADEKANVTYSNQIAPAVPGPLRASATATARSRRSP